MIELDINKRQYTKVNPSEQDSQHSIDIAFRNLSYSVNVPVSKALQKNGTKFTTREILKNINGICHGGQMTAILGASGAGKTSLLNILAQRIDNTKNVMVQGQLLANSKPYDSNQFSRFASYVMQNDILFETMTPREVLQFVANLKFKDQQMKDRQVKNTIKELKLERCQHTLIGGNLIKGISGGERKRTSIAVELVSDPQVILLDEPTSGLDSFTAFILLNLLKKICTVQKKTVIFTIHQPSTDIYELFDRIMLLVDGKFIYQGPKSNIISYFRSIGFDCPTYSNPMDYLMSIMHGESQININNYPIYFEHYNGILKKNVEIEIENMSQQEFHNKTVETTYGYQIGQICQRALLNIKRDRFLVKGRLIQAVFLSLIVGGIYWGVGKSAQTFKRYQSMNGVLFFFCMTHMMSALNPVMVTFPAERAVFLREENSKLYSTSAYFIGKSSVELPFLIIIPIISQIISYWMIGLNDREGKIVVIHMIIFVLQSLAGNSIGLMAGCVFKDVKVASGFLPAILMPLILFSGFFKNQNNLMDWIGWVQYLSPYKYAFEAAERNEYTGITLEKTYPDPIKTLGFDIGLWQSLVILFAFIIIYRTFALLFLNSIKSKLQ